MSANDQDKDIVERLIAETNLSARMDALIGEICDKLRSMASPRPTRCSTTSSIRSASTSCWSTRKSGLTGSDEEEEEEDEEEEDRSH